MTGWETCLEIHDREKWHINAVSKYSLDNVDIVVQDITVVSKVVCMKEIYVHIGVCTFVKVLLDWGINIDIFSHSYLKWIVFKQWYMYLCAAKSQPPYGNPRKGLSRQQVTRGGLPMPSSA